MNAIIKNKSNRRWRDILFEIIFEADTPAGKWFDIVLIISILLSVMTVMLDSVSSIRAKYGEFLYAAEWFFTILFTVEYIFRLLCIGKPIRYAVSFFGIVDLLAILPTYMSLLFFGSRYLLVVRILRVLRIFRVLKLGHHTKEAAVLREALYASRQKIIVFLFVVLSLVVIIGSLMYVIEEEENGFTSIPRSVYWAVVTLTTVGYGDISPKSGMGQFLAAIVMILGYSIIAIPTGIVTVELSRAQTGKTSSQACPNCSAEGHDRNAQYCKFCGTKL
ncbi:MAG: ion transporter [Deltaproteobacteria bacterium]|nr:ion transporter [Deltaproteobacteria bacterium]